MINSPFINQPQVVPPQTEPEPSTSRGRGKNLQKMQEIAKKSSKVTKKSRKPAAKKPAAKKAATRSPARQKRSAESPKRGNGGSKVHSKKPQSTFNLEKDYPEKTPKQICADSWKLFQSKYALVFYLCRECNRNLYRNDEKFEHLGKGQYLARIGMCSKCAVGNITVNATQYMNFGKLEKDDESE